MKNVIHDGLPFAELQMYGTTRAVLKDGLGNTVLDKTVNNNIMQRIRYPIIKLLGGYGNTSIRYRVGGSGPLSTTDALVPSSNEITVTATAPGNTLVKLGLDTSAIPFVDTIAFGTNIPAGSTVVSTVPVSSTDTGLTNPVTASFRKVSPNPIISADGLSATFVAVYPLTLTGLDGVTLREVGLFCGSDSSSGGTMVARALIGEFVKPIGMFFEFYWTIGYTSLTE